MTFRLGVDVGGTFTDLLLVDEASGHTYMAKVPSTPEDSSIGVLDGIDRICEESDIDPKQVMQVMHGTTVATNAVLTHKGAKVGLICTAGHEDSIEIRLGHKEDGYRYDPEYPPAVMLVPRYLRRGVRERIVSNGTVRTELHEADVSEACRFFLQEGVEAVAISFLWSVINSKHEIRAAEIVREKAVQRAHPIPYLRVSRGELPLKQKRTPENKGNGQKGKTGHHGSKTEEDGPDDHDGGAYLEQVVGAAVKKTLQLVDVVVEDGHERAAGAVLEVREIQAL